MDLLDCALIGVCAVIRSNTGPFVNRTAPGETALFRFCTVYTYLQQGTCPGSRLKSTLQKLRGERAKYSGLPCLTSKLCLNYFTSITTNAPQTYS